MPRIKSIKTGIEQTVSDTDWERMGVIGTQVNFNIIGSGEPVHVQVPEELQGATYSELTKQGSAHFKEKNYGLAMECYQKAFNIKASPYVKGRITACENKLNEA